MSSSAARAHPDTLKCLTALITIRAAEEGKMKRSKRQILDLWEVIHKVSGEKIQSKIREELGADAPFGSDPYQSHF